MMNCFSPSMQIDVFKFDSFEMDDQTTAGLASHLYSWDPFESKPFSFNILDNEEETNKMCRSYPICERIKRADSTIINKSTDSLLKLANNFKGQSIIDLFDAKSEPVAHKSLSAERRWKFQHQLRCWTFDVEQKNNNNNSGIKLSREDRVVGRKPQTATSTPTTRNASYSFGGYAMAVKKSLPTDASADSGLNISGSIEHSLPTFHQHNMTKMIKLHALRHAKSHDDGFYELSSQFGSHKEIHVTKNSPPPPAFRCRSKSIRKRQYVNGIHLKFIKPASQCPNWDKPNHRTDEPSCTLWHPKAPCYFYPNCRLTAELCGFAHPFCGNYCCKCASGEQSPQLNHLPRK